MVRIILYQHHALSQDDLVGEFKVPLRCLDKSDSQGGAALPARFTFRDSKGVPRAEIAVDAVLIPPT